MKKASIILLALVMVIFSAACGTNTDGTQLPDYADQLQSGDTPTAEALQPENTPAGEASQPRDTPAAETSQPEGALQFNSVEDVLLNQDETFFRGPTEYRSSLGMNLGDYLYIYDGQYFTDLREFSSAGYYSAGFIASKTGFSITLSDETTWPIIDRGAGDQLVMIISDHHSESWADPIDRPFSIFKLTFEGYCIPIRWENGQPDSFLLNKERFGGLDDHIDEIEGINIYNLQSDALVNDSDDEIRHELFLDVLSDLGFSTYDTVYTPGNIIMGDPDDTLSFVEYSGSGYNEFVIPFDTRLYSGIFICNLAPTRTKDGYMFYDLSQLEPGLYFFMNKVFKIQ